MTKDSRELFDEWYQREYVYRGLQENWRDTTHAIESLATWQAAHRSYTARTRELRQRTIRLQLGCALFTYPRKAGRTIHRKQEVTKEIL